MNSPSLRRRLLVGFLSLAMAQMSCSVVNQALGTNLGTQASQPNPAGSPAPSSCKNALFPVKVGATWTYAGQFSNNAYTRTFTITSVGSNGFEGTMHIADGSGNVLLNTTDSWQCTTTGLIEAAGPLGATLQSVYSGASMKTLSATGVTIPAQIRTGDAWSQVSQLEFDGSGGSVQSTLNYNFSAFGTEQVSVAAGTFNATKVQVHATTQAVLSGRTVDVTVSGFEWFAPGVGHVKSSETVYAFGIPFASEEGELQSYSIP